MNTATGAKLFTPTDLDEDHIRSLADMPELPDEERGAPRDVEQPPLGGLFDLPGKVQGIDDRLKAAAAAVGPGIN